MGSLDLIFQTWVIGLFALMALQFFVFIYAYRKKRIDFIDVFWGLSFVLAGFLYVLLNVTNLNFANFIAIVCIGIWGLRLVLHIFSRYKSSNKQDRRYTEITKSFINNPTIVYIKVFALQAVLANLVMVVFLSATLSSKYNISLLVIGLVIWLFGFAFESVADFQLKKHVTKKTGELMKTGLWKYSRHPNYFGELVQWWAIWLMLSGGEFAVFGLIGPIVISVLIIFVSGVPPSEKHMVKKTGWDEYRKSTSMIVPWLKYRKSS